MRRLATSSEPLAAARELGLTYQGGRTQVVIELGESAVIPSARFLDVMATAVVEDKILVQAELPVEDVCALASQPGVFLIRPATTGYPNEP